MQNDDDKAVFIPTPEQINAAVADIQEDWTPIQRRHALDILDGDIEMADPPVYKLLTKASQSRYRS